MNEIKNQHESFWQAVWRQYRSHRLGSVALALVGIIALVGIYAPFFASSKPLIIYYKGEWFFPLFSYLFYTGFFTKRLDIFYNLLMFTVPLSIATLRLVKRQAIWPYIIGSYALLQCTLFLWLAFGAISDPAGDPELAKARNTTIVALLPKATDDPLLIPLKVIPDFDFDLRYMTPYAKINMILRHQQRNEQHLRLMKHGDSFAEAAERKWLVGAVMERRAALRKSKQPIPSDEELSKQILAETPTDQLSRVTTLPTLWQVDLMNQKDEIARLNKTIESLATDYTVAKQCIDGLIESCRSSPKNDSNAVRSELAKARRVIEEYDQAKAHLSYVEQRNRWLEEESALLTFEIIPLVRQFHWEDDAGGEQSLNKYIPWYERTRINRKDLLSGLLFGIRVSLMVGILAVGLALSIGIPVGALAGFYGGKFDIIVSRLLEIWESMPTFFMLLMVVSVTQSKSIFLVIAVIGIFGWTGFSRFIRGEFFRQRNLSYVEACKSLGFRDRYIIFSHILPNAIPPVLTLLPFAIMGAITSEAGLSFLGLGEEGSCSWGVLMDEGRNAFPGESYLLWPPAIILTILLVLVAIVGDALRDSLDPKMNKV